MYISLTVLGTATPYPQPDRPCSGYLLRTATAQVWVDAGPGSLANLLRHTRLEALDAIWISHLHADHDTDLLAAYYALAHGGLGGSEPLAVYAPPTLGDRLAGFLRQDSPDFLAGTLRLHELRDGHRLDLDGLSLTARSVQHPVEAYALRAEYRGRTIVYSGDSGPCPALDGAAVGADLLLCETGADRAVGEGPPGHHTPEDAGALARRARVGRLVVTHIAPTVAPEEAIRRAAVVFGGPTEQAREGQTYTVS